MSSSEDVPLVGETLAGKYRVEKILGQGGMGVVLGARNVTINQYVALKLLLPKAAKLPDATSRFLREAKMAAAIQSEHVARVLDAGTLDNGTPFIAMEHLGGVDLAHHIKSKGALPIEQAVDFIVQAGDAVVEAHSIGIIHRDLKPGNMFLTRRPDGTPFVKVLDFGLSKSMLGDEADGSLTQTGAVLGSPFYMSPEQLRSLKLVDVRSDVWAMGVILYELVTGQRPFEGHSVTAICAAVIADKPPAPRDLRPEIPEQLEALILRCIEKDRERRVATIMELIEGIAPFGSVRSLQQVARISRRFSGSKEDVDDAVMDMLALGPPGGSPQSANAAVSEAGPGSLPLQALPAFEVGSETIRIVRPEARGPEGAADAGAQVTGIVWGHTPVASGPGRNARLALGSAVGLLLLMACSAICVGIDRAPEAPAAPDLAAAATPSAPESAAPLPTSVTEATPTATATPVAATETPPAADTASAESPAPSATEPPPAADTASATPPAPSAIATVAKPPVPKATAPAKGATAPAKGTARPVQPRPTGGKKHNPLDRSD